MPSVLSARPRRAWIRVLLVGCLALGLPAPVAAEPFFSLFAGGAFVGDTDLDSRIDLSGPVSLTVADGTTRDIELEPGLLLGGKLGYFFDPPVLGGAVGMELEVSRFQSTIEPQTARFSGRRLGAPFDGALSVQGGKVEVVAVALNALYRFPLATSPAFPRGRVQPYAGLGAGAFVATLRTSTTPLDVNRDVEDTDVRLGVQALVGARVLLTRNIALFAEAKYLHTAEFEFRFRTSGTVMGGVPVGYASRDRASLSGGQVYGGIAYHW